jgi:glutathione peroxidase
VEVGDEKGQAGDITWNFEKFLLDGSGSVVARFSPSVVPDDPRVVEAVERLLAA